MKVYIDSDEALYPHYVISKKYGKPINVSEEKLQEWRDIINKFHAVQEEMYNETCRYEYLKSNFSIENPSRTEKAKILKYLGWNQIDTSLWEKDGRQVRLHEAYDECKREFNESQEGKNCT